MRTQVSSQSRLEEVKQISDKVEQATSPQRNIINTRTLIFKANQTHLSKLSNLR